MYVPLFDWYSLRTTSFISGDATKSGVGVMHYFLDLLLVVFFLFELDSLIYIILFLYHRLLGMVYGKSATRGVPSAQSRKRLAIDLGSAVEIQGSFCQYSIYVIFRFYLFRFFPICLFHRWYCFIRIFIRTCRCNMVLFCCRSFWPWSHIDPHQSWK